MEGTCGSVETTCRTCLHSQCMERDRMYPCKSFEHEEGGKHVNRKRRQAGDLREIASGPSGNEAHDLMDLEYSGILTCGDEYVTALFRNGSRKTINVTCDSGYALIQDVMKGLK